MTELSDELLVAYVDGQLARKQTRAVEKVLEQDDVLARRVEALKHAHTRLEAAFEAVLAGEEADVSALAGREHRGIFIEWRVLTAGLAVLGIAASLMLAVAGYGWPLKFPHFMSNGTTVAKGLDERLSVTWQEEVVRAQALLSRQSVEIGVQGNQNLVAFQLAQAVGTSFKLPDLNPQGFRFVRAQLLRSGDQPLAQLLYLADEGAPLAFYARRGEGETAPVFERFGALGSVSWAEDGIDYLLAGGQDEALLARLAEKIRNEPRETARRALRPQSLPHSSLPTPQEMIAR